MIPYRPTFKIGFLSKYAIQFVIFPSRRSRLYNSIFYVSQNPSVSSNLSISVLIRNEFSLDQTNIRWFTASFKKRLEPFRLNPQTLDILEGLIKRPSWQNAVLSNRTKYGRKKTIFGRNITRKVKARVQSDSQRIRADMVLEVCRPSNRAWDN